MMKITIFKALALGLLSYVWVSGAAAATNCPAFNAAMVDATYMATDVSGPLESVVATNDPSGGTISCFIVTDNFDTFRVLVDPDDTRLVGASAGAQLRTVIGPAASGPQLTPAELHACRGEVMQAFVWNEHCAVLVQ